MFKTRRQTAIWSAVLVPALAAAGVLVAVIDPFAASGNGKRGVRDNGYPTSLATVTRGSLSSQTSVGGTLGYAGMYGVVNQRQGTYTALPGAGQVVGCGGVLYRVTNSPVALLCGATPAYARSMRATAGRMSGSSTETWSGWRMPTARSLTPHLITSTGRPYADLCSYRLCPSSVVQRPSARVMFATTTCV